MKTSWKITISVILAISLYRLVALLFSTYPFEYKLLLIFGVLIFFFFVLTASSCYYFRQFSAGASNNICNVEKECSACQPEGFLDKNHRFFYWPLFFLVPTHLFYVFSLGFISLADPFFSFVAISLGITFFFWLVSCRYFKFFFREKILVFHPKSLPGKIFYGTYGKIKKFYPHHSTFFWLVLVFLSLHLFTILLRRI